MHYYTCTMQNLPNEIIIEILSRLPLKSLCRSNCVSKPWRTIIANPDFIKVQTKKQRLIIACESLYSVDLQPLNDGSGDLEAVKLDYPLENNSSTDGVQIIGSCNGVICIVDKSGTFFMYNPCTGEFKNIQISVCIAKSAQVVLIYKHRIYMVFDYASAVDDYRFVKVTHGNVAVYSSKTGNLTDKVQFFTYNVPFHFVGAPLNGAIHWVVSLRGNENNICVIAAYDLTKEDFTDLPVPDDEVTDFRRFSGGVLDGCLCLMHFDNSKTHDEFWVMKEYGVKASWIKIEMTSSYNVLKPMCLMKNGKALLVIDEKRLVLSNQENGACEDVVVRGIPDQFDSDIYVESLVSPNMGNGD